MSIGRFCNKHVVTAARNTTVLEAAHLMRHNHVGDVLVVDDTDGGRVPVGILTDRDIVVSVIAPGLDPASLQVGDIMTDDLLTARDTDDVYETIERMRLRGIRRVPVVDARGSLAGVVSADDLLEFLAEEMGELSRISPYQQAHEKRARQ